MLMLGAFIILKNWQRPNTRKKIFLLNLKNHLPNTNVYSTDIRSPDGVTSIKQETIYTKRGTTTSQPTNQPTNQPD